MHRLQCKSTDLADQGDGRDSFSQGNNSPGLHYSIFCSVFTPPPFHFSPLFDLFLQFIAELILLCWKEGNSVSHFYYVAYPFDTQAGKKGQEKIACLFPGSHLLRSAENEDGE